MYTEKKHFQAYVQLYVQSSGYSQSASLLDSVKFFFIIANNHNKNQ